MKKIISVMIYAACMFFMVTACKNPPIFAAIEQEVKLKPASLRSFIRGIVKIDDMLYTTNGTVFRKTFGDRGKWTNIPGAGGRCIGLAADGTSLYGIFESGESFKAYRTDKAASTWTAVGDMEHADFIAGTKTIFAADTANKKVYVLKDGAVAGSWPSDKTPLGAAGVYCLLANGLYTAAGSVVAGGPTDPKGICDGPDSSVFIFDAATLYCYNGSAWTKIAHKVSSPQSITYLPRKQLVLISGKSGFGEIKLTDGTNITTAKIVTAGSEDSSLPQRNYYQYQSSIGKWFINPIVAFDHGESGYIIYAGALDPNAKYSGLWGFYHPEQIEWNRE